MRVFLLIGTWLALLCGACSFSSKLTTGGTPAATNTANTSPAVRSESGVTVPELRGLTVEQAKAALRQAGFESELRVDERSYDCDHDFKASYARFEVCGQRPRPGTATTSRAVVTANYEQDEPDHGNIGFSGEWRRMPDLIGKSLAEARKILAAAQLPADEHFELVAEGDCAKNTVCQASPRAGDRKVLVRKGRLVIGNPAPVAPPAAPVTPTAPTAAPVQPEPAKETYF